MTGWKIVGWCVAFALLSSAIPSAGADLTLEQVRAAARQDKCNPCRGLADKNLSDLDLSGFDLHGADLSGSNLFGTRLASANLAGANLSGANLNGAWLMGANFSGANLRGASLLSVVIVGGEIKTRPTFAGADLSNCKMLGEFDGADFTGARLDNLHAGVNIKNQGMGQMRTNLSGAKLTGAHLAGADLNRSLLRYADLRNADLRNADLFRADLSGADLSGARLAGANMTEAVVEGTILKGVQGMGQVKGFDAAEFRDKAILR